MGEAQQDKAARVVIVGGGVAGLEIASALGKLRDPHTASVTLVDADSAHVWKPMLHTIAAGTRDLAQQQTTYLAQAADAGFAYQPGEMCGLDRSAKEVLLAPITAPDDGIARHFDHMLWSFQPLAFVPHVPATSPRFR